MPLSCSRLFRGFLPRDSPSLPERGPPVVLCGQERADGTLRSHWPPRHEHGSMSRTVDFGWILNVHGLFLFPIPRGLTG